MILFVAWQAVVGSSSEMFAALGLVAAIEVTGAFLIVFWWSLSSGHPQPPSAGIGAVLTRGLSALANRDGLCLTVWVAMLLDRPVWFLWAFALGANVYWMLWLAVYGVPRRSDTRST